MVDSVTGEYNPKSNGEMVKKAGYADGVAFVQPNTVMNSAGTQIALTELGFTPENAKKVVTKILEGEDSANTDKLRAADMIFKVHGEYASDKIAKENNANPIVFAKIEQHIYNFETELKKALGYENKRIIQAGDEK